MSIFSSRKKSPDPPDQDLVELFKNSHDLKYVTELFLRYSHLVYGICLKYLKDSDSAKDAVMDVFEKLVVELKKHEVTYFGSWLHTLTRNFCLMRLRGSKQTFSYEENVQTEAELNMEFDPLVHLEESGKELKLNESLMEGIKNLNEEQRLCIDLFYLQNKSYKEVSDLTGYDFNSVKSNIQNGKRNLKIYLERNNG